MEKAEPATNSPANNEALIKELRERLISAFYWMDENDRVFHPMAVEDIWRMAELLEIDTNTVPTEGRAIFRRGIKAPPSSSP